MNDFKIVYAKDLVDSDFLSYKTLAAAKARVTSNARQHRVYMYAFDTSTGTFYKYDRNLHKIVVADD